MSLFPSYPDFTLLLSTLAGHLMAGAPVNISSIHLLQTLRRHHFRNHSFGSITTP
jgi:hypothetical protein